MDNLGWIESSSFFSLPVPSLGHIFALLTIIGIWLFPRASAFDPSPRSSKNTNNPLMITSTTPSGPPPKDPSPPLVRSLSEWETGSSGSCDADSVAEDPTCAENGAPQSPAPHEPSYFLKSQCPDSTQEERHRFLVARNGNEEAALKNLLRYWTWRKQFDTLRQEQEERHQNIQQDDESDLYDWIVASQTALQANKEARDGWQWLPRVIRTHKLPNGNGEIAKDCDGKKILHMMPAQIDDRACSLETYSLAIALYLDRKFSRDSLEKGTILMDLRPGQGWRNTSAVRLLPFIKSIVGLLLSIFPERLHRSVLYPLPFALSWVFNAAKAVIDPKTASKLVVLTGSAAQASPMPLDKLSQYVSRDVALMCENERLDSFSC